MVALAALQRASFRGAPFLVPEDDLHQGPNTVDHKFPGQNRRFAEWNGTTPPEFHLTCYLHGPSLLSDWSRLETALNRPGPGTLQHPWLGSRLCSVKGPYKVKRSDHDSGVLRIDVVFLETGPAAFGRIAVPFAASVTRLADATCIDIWTSFTLSFRVPRNPFSASYLFGLVRSVANIVQRVFSATSSVASAAAALGLSEILSLPDLLALFQGPFSDRSVSADQLVSGYKSVFAEVEVLADEVDAIAPTTQDLTERKASADLIVSSALAASFAAMAEAMAAKAQASGYKTADAVDADMTTLALALETLSPRPLDAGVRASLIEIYAAISAVLQALEVTLPRIVAMQVAGMPASVLSYMLYDTDERQSALIDLNTDLSPLLLDGEISVLNPSTAEQQ